MISWCVRASVYMYVPIKLAVKNVVVSGRTAQFLSVDMVWCGSTNAATLLTWVGGSVTKSRHSLVRGERSGCDVLRSAG